MPDQETTFNLAYRASLSPELGALMDMPYGSPEEIQAKEAKAAQLATQGFIVDVPIMAWGFNPYKEMSQMEKFNFTWVPSALQQPLGSPGGIAFPGVPPQPGQVAYDPLHPPPGSLKVSTNPADFPPFIPPPPPPPPITDPVGPQAVGNIYLTVAGDSSPDGRQFTDSRGTFVKHIVPTPFGHNSWWEKIS